MCTRCYLLDTWNTWLRLNIWSSYGDIGHRRATCAADCCPCLLKTSLTIHVKIAGRILARMVKGKQEGVDQLAINWEDPNVENDASEKSRSDASTPRPRIWATKSSRGCAGAFKLGPNDSRPRSLERLDFSLFAQCRQLPAIIAIANQSRRIIAPR